MSRRKHHRRVERWRTIVEWNRPPDTNPDDTDYMLFLMWHESRGKWRAHNRRLTNPWYQASGLLQHIPQYWSWRIRQAILTTTGDDWVIDDETDALPHHSRFGLIRPVGIFNPTLNILAAWWLQQEAGWDAWSPAHTFPRDWYDPTVYFRFGRYHKDTA